MMAANDNPPAAIHTGTAWLGTETTYHILHGALQKHAWHVVRLPFVYLLSGVSHTREIERRELRGRVDNGVEGRQMRSI